MVWVYTGVACGAVGFGALYYYLFRSYDRIDEESRLKRMADQSTFEKSELEFSA